MNRQYKELIFTNHALERARQRDVTLSAAWATWRSPQQSRYAATKGAWIKRRSWGNRTIEVVVKQNERKQWVVISVWAKDNYGQFQLPWIFRLLRWLWRKIWNA